MGPGPSDVPDTVLRALSLPTVGHLDPAFLRVMDEIRERLRAVFRTRNALTLPISGTGSAGLEACLANLVSPGSRVLVGVNGVFGERLADVAVRYGAEVRRAEAPWGEPLDPDTVRRAAAGEHFDLLCAVHAETSTGVRQDIPPLRAVADSIGALLLVDTVTSLAGIEVDVDEWGIDATYSATQKCLSCPPGLAPISLSPRAESVLAARKTAVRNWYLDLSLLGNYWGGERAYHHTAPVNMLVGLDEGLRLVLDETLPTRFARHATNSRALVSGLEALGLRPRVPEAFRLPQLITVAVPDGVDDARTRRALLDRFGLEIGGGLGPMRGNTWRIGLMGASCTERNVLLCLAALQTVLRDAGHRGTDDPIDAARDAWK